MVTLIQELAGHKQYGPMHVYNGKLTIFGGGSSTIEAFKEDDETWETVDTVAGFNSSYSFGLASVPIYCKVWIWMEANNLEVIQLIFISY